MIVYFKSFPMRSVTGFLFSPNFDCLTGIMNVRYQKSIEAVREAYESAINDAGINLAEGGLVWNAYRSFESTLLEVLEESGGQNAERLYV